MAEKLIVDCIGRHVLTIAVAGAIHSLSIETDVLFVSGQGRAIEYELDSLPLTFDVSVLNGKLTIYDKEGRLVYCRRSSIEIQPRLRLETSRMPSPRICQRIPDPSTGTSGSTAVDDASHVVDESSVIIDTNQELRRTGLSKVKDEGDYPKVPMPPPLHINPRITSPIAFTGLAAGLQMTPCFSTPHQTPRAISTAKKPQKAQSIPNTENTRINPPALRPNKPTIVIPSLKPKYVTLKPNKLSPRELHYLSTSLTPTRKNHWFFFLDNLTRYPESYPFRSPTSPGASPCYPRPMDLQTMMTNLTTDRYKSMQHLIDDFDLIIDNAVRFHAPDDEVLTRCVPSVRCYFKICVRLLLWPEISGWSRESLFVGI